MHIFCFKFLFSVHVQHVFNTVIIYIFSMTSSLFLIVVSEKFQLDLSMVRTQELNFILCSEIFVHYNEQLKESHLILSCVPFYNSYQDSSSTLIVSSPLLFYLDIWLLGFLPHGLTSGKARHQGSKRVRQGSLELVRDSSTDTIFQGWDVHIPMEAPVLEAFVVEASIPINPITGIV